MQKHALVLGALSLLATVSVAHEDDPKILDRQPAYEGRGYRSGQAANLRAFGLNAQTAGATLSFPSSNVQLLSWLTLSELGSGVSGANDCWGYVSPAGVEYALIGLSNGTAFVRLDDPTNPTVVATLTGPTSSWRDIKTYQDHAYAVSEGGSGIQVFDLSGIDTGSVQLVNTITTGGTTASHNVAIDEASGRLYRLGGSSNGLRAYDLSNPSNPVFLGSWMDRYIHDAQFVTYTSGPYAGKQIAFASSGFNGSFTNTGLDVLDVTDPNNVIVMANIQYPNPAYSHQCWLSADANFLYLNDELDENGLLPTTTFVFDVSDPGNPSTFGTFTNGNTAIGHNLYTKGNQIFEANYRSGLRVFDSSVSQTSPTESAFFDTYPDSDSDNFNGLWSNYPFFPSGVVIGSDIEKGLFVWWVGAPLLTFSAPGGLPSMVDPSGDTLLINVNELNPGDLVPGTVQIHFDDGVGTSSVAMTPMGGGNYQANLPAVPCGQDFAYYFTAETTNGMVWQDPIGGSGDVHTAAATLGQNVAFDFDMESVSGWVAGDPGDDATTGIWTVGNPNGTTSMPEDDHSPSGSSCWFTGQGAPGGAAGSSDIDGGGTSLFTPIMDLTTLQDPVARFWLWYSNASGSAPLTDVFRISMSEDGGANWTEVEAVGPGGPAVKGGWFFHQLRVLDYTTNPANFQMRFVASDRGTPSVVDAALDDFAIVENGCSDCDGNGRSDDFDILDGLVTDFDANGIPDPCDPMREDFNTISLSAGGMVTFDLDAGPAMSLASYWIFGSVSGTSPGVNFGSINLPLNFDAYFNLTLNQPGLGGVFMKYRNFFDINGRSTASFTVPAGADPGLVGITFHHAYIASTVIGDVEFASNAVPVTFVP